jgi:hypothetical protein
MTGSVFRTDLEYSRRSSEDEQWMGFYHFIFGRGLVVGCDTGTDNEWQRHGVDRVLFLSGGRMLRIDEKKRRNDYGDFLAEIWSPWYGEKDQRNRPGWTVDPTKQCDYVAYGPSGGRFYLLPFDILRLATRRDHKSWKERITRRDQDERGYQTVNAAVGWDELFRAMRRVQEIGGGKELKLAKLANVCGQDVFGFMADISF